MTDTAWGGVFGGMDGPVIFGYEEMKGFGLKMQSDPQITPEEWTSYSTGQTQICADFVSGDDQQMTPEPSSGVSPVESLPGCSKKWSNSTGQARQARS